MYNTKGKNYTIKLPIRKDYYSIISKLTVDKRNESVVISYLTEEEEKKIDKHEDISIKRGNLVFNIKPEDIYCYGNIDFNNGSQDMDIISSFTWLDHLTLRGVCVPANYNYEKHECKSINRKPMWYDTTKNEVVAKYAHGFINKPKLTIIFRHVK